MDNNKILGDDRNQETALLDDDPSKLTEQEEQCAKEFVRLNGFGIAWDILSFFILLVFEWQNFMQQLSDSVQKQSYATLLILGFLFLILLPIQIILLFEFGTPGIFMSRQLKINVRKSMTGMVIYLVVLLISLVSSTHIFNFFKGHEDRLFCAMLACIYNFSCSTFLLGHGSAALVLFPLKVLCEPFDPLCDSETIYFLKFCTLGAIEAWIYIAALYCDKNYNQTSELHAGESSANLLAKEVIGITQMIIIPTTKLILLYLLIVCGYLIVRDCIVLPAIALVRRNRFVLPRHAMHIE